MTNVYVLTNETDGNSVIGVYSTMKKAINALFNAAETLEVVSSCMEPVGVRFVFLAGTVPVRYYIEEVELDETLFLQKSDLY